MTERGVGENEAPGTLRESTRSQEEGSQSVGRSQPKATELEQVQRPVSRWKSKRAPGRAVPWGGQVGEETASVELDPRP